MADLTQSEWFNGIIERFNSERKKLVRKHVITVVIMIIIAAVACLVDKMVLKIAYLGMAGIVVAFLAIVMGIVYLIGDLTKGTGSFKKRMAKTFTSQEMLSAFDCEINNPITAVQTNLGEAIITPNFAVTLSLSPLYLNYIKVVPLNKVGFIKVYISRTNAVFNFMQVSFHEPGAKKGFEYFKFFKREEGDAFLNQLKAQRAGIMAEQ